MNCVVLFVIFSAVIINVVSSQGITKKMLDAMMQLHDAGEVYDEETWQEILSCMQEYTVDGIDVQASSDGGWDGFLQYSDTNGQLDGSDPWRQGGWIEWNPTPLSDDNNTVPGATEVTINEPCNFVSNAAYCRTAVAMCAHQARGGWNFAQESVTGLVRSYISLCMGSAFFHASGTSLGGAVDNMPIGHLALIAHQASLKEIPYSPILHDMSETPRSKLGYEFAEEMTVLFINESVYIWEDRINAMDVPNYYNTFASTVVAVFHLIFPTDIASAITAALIPLFLSPDEVEFVLGSFEPELIQAYIDNDVVVRPPVATDLAGRGLGTLVKMLFAFAWQEQLIPGPWLYDPEANIRGASTMPEINAFGNSLSGYNHTDADIQNCILTYPGDEKCRKQEPHSKWHEQSGNALVDLMWLTDDMDRVITGIPLPRRVLTNAFPIETCMNKNKCLDEVDWTNVQWPSWLSNSLGSCLPVLWKEWMSLDYSGFTGCMLPNVIEQIHQLPNVLTKDTLEGCLVQNNCIVPDVNNNVNGLNTDILYQCIAVKENKNTCVEYIDVNVVQCISTKCNNDKDIFCMMNCFSDNLETSISDSQLTTSTKAIGSCLPLIGSSDFSGFITCIKSFGRLGELEILFEPVLPVVQAISDCIEGPCAENSNQIISAGWEVKECFNWCMKTESYKPFASITINREIGCTADCYFNLPYLQNARQQ